MSWIVLPTDRMGLVFIQTQHIAYVRDKERVANRATVVYAEVGLVSGMRFEAEDGVIAQDVFDSVKEAEMLEGVRDEHRDEQDSAGD